MVMSRKEIMAKFQHHVLEHGEAPASVYLFCKELELSEREFFDEFGSFDGLEAAIWERAVKTVIKVIGKTEEWKGFNAQQKLLTFYYTFCDHILEDRSYFLARFPRVTKQVGQPPENLKGMRIAFTAFADEVLEAGRESGEVARRGALTRAYPMGMFGHFVSIVEFNLADTSAGFERTDAFIEKSVRLLFDVIGTQAVDSALDLIRFITGRARSRTED